MIKEYGALSWGARYHLKRDESGNDYLVGVKQKNFAIYGFITLVPLGACLVMAALSWFNGDNARYFFLPAAVLLGFLCVLFFSRRERFSFDADRVQHLIGWKGLGVTLVDDWSVSDCRLTVIPIAEHKEGCWLHLSINGKQLWRNSIGSVAQTVELALFMCHDHQIAIFDGVTDWPDSKPLMVVPSEKEMAELGNVEPEAVAHDVAHQPASYRHSETPFRVEGSLWRLVWIFPVMLVLGALLFIASL
ncbi:hypothetical protein [Enterovibrio norvegicus]|uniref:hypothetical protein n=1 Tax=Enterovibrio norvegicus TaxID=188144 RepID=UPI001E2EFFF3|nr:hypothetical protein [Enterovibrio norvegicus]MCC4800253.1 hypothetical protein [Enterovibrio norvegicus]